MTATKHMATESEQRTFDDFKNQCRAIAESTAERYTHPPIPPFDYCAQHFDERRISEAV